MRSRGLNKFKALLLFLAIVLNAALSAQVGDTLEIEKERKGLKVLSFVAVPTILIGSGISTMNDRGLYSSQDAYECIQRNYPDFHSGIDDYLVFVPAAAVYGLNLAGVKGKHNFLDRSAIYIVSLSLALGTAAIIKHSTDILRPDGSDYLSFPSNHTTVAFVSATLLHEEYKDRSPWYGIAGYSIATISGMLRMLNNRHWMSDVLVGAGLGILSTKAVYLLYPLVKKSLGGNNSNLTMLPYAAPRHFGIFLQYKL